MLCLFSLLRLLVLGVLWESSMFVNSGRSALYGGLLAVPAVPCESGVSAVPGRVCSVADGFLTH